MNQKGFAPIIVILALVLIGIGSLIFLFLRPLRSNKSFLPSFDQATGCPKDLSGVFTKSIVDPNKILALRALGYTSGTDHILPIEHTGFTFKVDSPGEKVPVYAPAKITITQIAKHTDYTADGKPFSNVSNYMFDFTICQNIITGWSEWVHHLSPELQSIWDQAKKTHDEGPLNQGARAINDTAKINFTAEAGDLLGYTGAEPSLALSIFDTRSKHTDVDFSYYADSERRANAICFTDLYSGDLKKTLTDKYGYYENRLGQTPGFTARTIEPRCGEVIQNIAGTIQGDWFANKPVHPHESLEAQGKTISFIHHYLDPSIAVISIGGNIVPDAETWMFKPTHSGIINLEFSETKTGKIYCYQSDPKFDDLIYSKKKADGRILVELTDNHHIKIEAQPGSCGENNAFSNAFTYER